MFENFKRNILEWGCIFLDRGGRSWVEDYRFL